MILFDAAHPQVNFTESRERLNAEKDHAEAKNEVKAITRALLKSGKLVSTKDLLANMVSNAAGWGVLDVCPP